MVAEPGTAWNYCQGLDVLGGVIEKITGQTLDEAVQERVTGPLGMTDTALLPAEGQGGALRPVEEAGCRCTTTTR